MVPQLFPWSNDADGVRASKIEHAVEDRDANGDLRGLRLIGMEPGP